MTYLLRESDVTVRAGDELRVQHPGEFKVDHHITIPGLGRAPVMKGTGRKVKGQLRVSLFYGPSVRRRVQSREVSATQRGVDGVLRRASVGGEAAIASATAELEAAEQQLLAARAKLAQALRNAYVLGARVPIAELRKLVPEEVAR